ncbi:MAG: hypothetical protein NVV62_03615 [Terricaulis sp.]|nr:hypothetical protein [Terricaulis sp.]
MTRPTLITNAKLIDPAKSTVETGAILFDDAILDVGAVSSAPDGAEIIDAGGLYIAPGLIDMRVVIGEPGAEHKETFKSAGRAAANGGVTTMVMMPNTNPVIDDQSLVDFVRRRGPDRDRRGAHPARRRADPPSRRRSDDRDRPPGRSGRCAVHQWR